MTAFDPTKLARTQPTSGGQPAGETPTSSNLNSSEQNPEQSEGQTSSCLGYFKERVCASGGKIETVGVPCDHDNDRCKRLRDVLATNEAGFESTGTQIAGPYSVSNVDCGNTTIMTLSNVGQDNSRVYARRPNGMPSDPDRKTAQRKLVKDAPNSRGAEKRDQSSTGDASCPGYNTRAISKRDGSCETLDSPCKHDNERCEKRRRDKFGERRRDEGTNSSKPSQWPSQKSSRPDPEEVRGGTAGPGWTPYYAPYPYGDYTTASAYAHAGYGGAANATSVTNIGSNNVYTHIVSNVGNINTIERDGAQSAENRAAVEDGRRMRDEGKGITEEAKRSRGRAQNTHEAEWMPDYPPAPGWGAYSAYGMPSAHTAPSYPFPPPSSPYFYGPGPSQ